jgi:O-6-methylguanine DNA methyltransferase
METKYAFADRVRAVVRKIPRGTVLSYKQVAYAAGNPLAHRAVANVMSKNYDPTVPCHRVIRSDGKLGGYNRGGIERKRELLLAEGVKL